MVSSDNNAIPREFTYRIRSISDIVGTDVLAYFFKNTFK